MKITLVDRQENRLDLLPITFTRPVSEIRVGILTIREKWERIEGAEVSNETAPYLQSQYPNQAKSDFFVASNIIPNPEFISALKKTKDHQTLVDNEGHVLATRTQDHNNLNRIEQSVVYNGELNRLNNLWDIFLLNGEQIVADYEFLTADRQSQDINDKHTIVYNRDNIFVEENVEIRAAILNAENGPIYLGRNCKINEGAIIQGPFALGEQSVVNMGAKVRKNTSIGPYCKVGGELSNTVMLGYSNKAHDGFLGNSVIGEWCNLGADTNTSNLKNDYSEIKIWNYRSDRFIPTGLQFCGLMMGDHSKCAINTMFNTGTVVGVAANIFGAGFPRTSVPSFSWGGSAGYKTFNFEKALESCGAMVARRNIHLSEEEISILKVIYEDTAKYRIWENAKK